MSKKIVILASGAGSNARNIIRFFRESKLAEVVLVASNNPQAGVLSIAKEFGIPTYLLTNDNFKKGRAFIELLQTIRPDAIVLAGFLWKVPAAMVQAFPDKILNIHPALLPKYGGKGMYGHHVHEAVHAAGERKSGITIHLVNEHYDEGAPLFQATCELTETDSPTDIERKVRALEIEHFPKQVARFLGCI